MDIKKTKKELLKKLITGALAVIMAGTSSFALTSCSGGADDSQSGYSETSETVEEVTETETEAPKIAIPVSRKKALKMNYEKLKEKFQDAGFTEVAYEALEDLKSSKSKKNEKVAALSIDGKKKFKKGKKISADTEIEIKYHSVKEAYPPVDNSDLEYDELDCEDVVTQYEKEGFNNIKTKKVVDNSKPEGTVKKISIDGETDYFTDCPVDSKVVITYYTKKAAKPKKSSGGSVGVSSNVKKMLDEYEKFMDKYVAFMKKYKNSDNVAGMLSDYADMVEQEAEWIKKINAIKKDDLSAADAAYYLKVTARVTKKLSEVE